MKLLFVLIAFSLVVISHAAMNIQLLEACPGHPGRCYSPGPPEIDMAVGEVRQVPGKCQEMTCNKHDDKFSLHFASCGKVHVDKPCTTVTDKSKPYPECCPKPRCPQ